MPQSHQVATPTWPIDWPRQKYTILFLGFRGILVVFWFHMVFWLFFKFWSFFRNL